MLFLGAFNLLAQSYYSPLARMLIRVVPTRWSAVRDQWALSTSVTFLLPNDLQQGLEDQSVQAVLVWTSFLTFSSSSWWWWSSLSLKYQDCTESDFDGSSNSFFQSFHFINFLKVVTPTPTHQAIVLQRCLKSRSRIVKQLFSSLAAGKDVFCEKPLAETEEGIR